MLTNYKKMKIFNDTLKSPNGKYSRKSVTAFASFFLAIIYEMVLPFFGLTTKEYVFITLLALSGSTLGLTVLDKKNMSNTTNTNEL